MKFETGGQMETIENKESAKMMAPEDFVRKMGDNLQSAEEAVEKTFESAEEDGTEKKGNLSAEKIKELEAETVQKVEILHGAMEDLKRISEEKIRKVLDDENSESVVEKIEALVQANGVR